MNNGNGRLQDQAAMLQQQAAMGAYGGLSAYQRGPAETLAEVLPILEARAGKLRKALAEREQMQVELARIDAMLAALPKPDGEP